MQSRPFGFDYPVSVASRSHPLVSPALVFLQESGVSRFKGPPSAWRRPSGVEAAALCLQKARNQILMPTSVDEEASE